MNKIRGMIFNNWKLILVILILIILTLLTAYRGSIDVGDYSDTAKYFSGDYSAKIRNSHSYIFGLIHSPLVAFTQSFIFFKISSLFILLGIIFSVYYISGKNKKGFLIALFSPIIWYMAPWISPIQLASLCLLWAYHFLIKYEKGGPIKNQLISGFLIGLSICFWNAACYFGIALLLAFFFNKKFYQLIIFCLAILIGLIPLFLTDFYLFNFPFYTLIKTNLGQFLVSFSGSGIDGVSVTFLDPMDLLFVILSLPIYFWSIYKPSFVKSEVKSVAFVSLSLGILIINPQVRYVLAIAPIILILILKELNNAKLKKYLIFSTILILIFIIPYVLQVKYSLSEEVGGIDGKNFIRNFKNLSLSEIKISEQLLRDINQITTEYPLEIFIVGNQPDDYQILADIYWGKEVKEFVSIQDYNLYLTNQINVFQKKIMSSSNINDRRQIWISGGIDKNPHDRTDYASIQFAIGIDEPINLEDFNLVSSYGRLYLSKKIDST